MSIRSWLLSLFDGTSHRSKIRPARKKLSSPGAWVKNTSSIPDMPFFEAGGPAVKRHFSLADQIEAAWKTGDREKIVKLCEMQIALSGEVRAALEEEDCKNGREVSACCHTGFTRLAMLHEKEKNYQQAMRVCEQAISDGWLKEEYERRAARCRKKLAKHSPS